jgi:hypothetical protein
VARLLGLGLAAVASVVPLAGGAAAKVETEPRSEKSGPPESAAETGGHRLIDPGPFRLSCQQDGVTIAEASGVEHIAVPPTSLIGALSFRQRGNRRSSIVLPLGDGFTTCALSPELERLRPAAAAVERAIVANQVTTWSLAPADASGWVEASGRVEPVRSFTNRQGRACRVFLQSITIAGHREIAHGVACRSRRGSWRLIR